MQKNILKLYKNISFVFLAVAFVLILLVVMVTYLHQDTSSANRFVFWTVENHLTITIGIMVFAVLTGYSLSSLTYRALQKTRQESKTTLETLLLFLSMEEREIISHLVEKRGTTSQAEISRLPNMTRVKAFRCLQKMKENNLIEINPRGKVRDITLKSEVYNLLDNSNGT